jgi:hypothetical protein
VRSDIATVRVQLTPDTQPLDLSIAHVDLYFFFEIDIAILGLELYATDIALTTAQDVMFRLGRSYPAYWEPTGQAGHCPSTVEFIAKSGQTVAASDYEDREFEMVFRERKRAAKKSSPTAANCALYYTLAVGHRSRGEHC